MMEARLLEHAEEFVVLGDAAVVNKLHEVLKTIYTVKLVAQTGEGDQEQEAVVLNWLVRNMPRATSGLVMLFNRHCIEDPSTVQRPIRLSSDERQVNACVKGGAAFQGKRSPTKARMWALLWGCALPHRRPKDS